MILESVFSIFNTWKMKIFKYSKYYKQFLKSLLNIFKNAFDNDFRKFSNIRKDYKYFMKLLILYFYNIIFSFYKNGEWLKISHTKMLDLCN